MADSIFMGGLYVPDSAVDKRKVMAGWVEAVGPGYPIPDMSNSSEEPWKPSENPSIKHYPLQVEKGDFVLYVKTAAWEIRLDSGVFFVVPYSSVLVILRTPLDVEHTTN
jgi:chaperonin GroES